MTAVVSDAVSDDTARIGPAVVPGIHLAALLVLLLFLTACSGNKHYQVAQFKLAEPRHLPFVSKVRRFDVEPTFYFTPQFQNRSSGFPLLDMNNRPIRLQNGETIYLSEKEWCTAALEGSVKVASHTGASQTFNYAGLGASQVDCTGMYGEKFRATNRVRFRAALHAWGDGADNCALIPYRSIAVDPGVIPIGSVVYIPSARGLPFYLDKLNFHHDGYFIASDVGGMIRGNRIDMFLGERIPNDVVRYIYRSGKEMETQLVTDAKIRQILQGNSRCAG